MLPARFSLRPATPADIGFLLALREQTMSDHLRASGVEPSEAERAMRVALHFDCAQILLEHAEPAGLFKVRREAQDWELVQIQVLPRLQGCGIGRALVAGLLAEAEEAGARVHLSVLTANPARRLYERLGFRLQGQASPAAFSMCWSPAANRSA